MATRADPEAAAVEATAGREVAAGWVVRAAAAWASPASEGGGMGGGGMGRGRGREGRQSAESFKATIRWESAKPILEALKTPLPEAFADHYVISVSGLPLNSER